MSTTETKSSPVEIDAGRNKKFAIYLGAWVVIAIVLFTWSAFFHLGYGGWLGGAFALLIGAGGLGGMMKTGGAGKFACPSCGHNITVLHVSLKRTLPCPSCGTWVEGAKAMATVPLDRVYTEGDGVPFVAPLTDGTIWPEQCPKCAGPEVRRVRIEGVPNAIGAMVAAQVIGVGIATRYTIDVPACGAHDAATVGVLIVGVTHPTAKVGVCFSSMAYWRSFCEANQHDPAQAPRWMGIPLPTT